MKPVRITAVEATPINVPSTRPERWSFGEVHGMTSILVRVHTDAGLVGLGESVSGGPSIQVALTAVRELGELLVGRDATAVEPNLRRLVHAGGWHWYGRRSNVILAGLETALWDLLGKALDAPIHALLGGALRDELPFMYFLQRSGMELEGLVEEATAAVADGWETVYIKGGNDVEADVELLTRLREAVGPRVRLRMDCNEAWMEGTAIAALHRLEPLHLEFVEQPIRFDSLDGLARLRHATAVPIAANQSGWTTRDIFEIGRARAADVIVTDIHQEGGIAGFRRACELAEVVGLPIVHHAFTTSTIGIVASMQVMCTRPNCFHLAHQIHPPGFVEDDVVTVPIEAPRGRGRVPTGPGLGVELDEAALARAVKRFEDDGAYPLFDPDTSPFWVPMA